MPCGVSLVGDYVGNTAIGHAHYPVAIRGQMLVVSDDNECLPHIAAQIGDKAMELGTVMAVEAAGWFIGKHHVGAVDQCAGYGTPLAFAAGELRRAVIGAPARPR